MRYGVDRLISSNFKELANRRVGLFTTLNTVRGDLTPTYEVFRTSDRVDLRALFGPEHGLSGTVAEGVSVDSMVDTRSGLPVYSLYGANQQPTEKMLTDIDVLVCDIQDIGVRYYTFLWTVTHILEACGQHNTDVMILDRPNPCGAGISGAGLSPALQSLVGRFAIPVQHGMTIGEVSQLVNDVWNPFPVNLEIIACEDWERAMQWPEIGQSFVPPSPNMPRYETVLQYAGSCLIEGTTLSEGRGTPLPFEIVGAPYIDHFVLASAINAASIPGAIARPYLFQPSSGKYRGETCSGIQLHITDVSTFQPIESWLTILSIIRRIYPDDFQWLPPHKEIHHFDRLIGDTTTRQLIDEGASVEQMCVDWHDFQDQFRQLRAPFLIYGDE